MSRSDVRVSVNTTLFGRGMTALRSVLDAVKCARCGGLCCQYVEIAVQDMNLDQQRWARTRGVLSDGMWWIHSRCKHLREHARCAIYSQRMRVCRDRDVGGRKCKQIRAIDKQRRKELLNGD